MKIGIFGGSFNPPHNTHRNIALELIEKGYLDKIIYVPTGDSYKKENLINFKYRLRMVELMTLDYDNLSVSDIGNDDNYTYTYQTLDYFQNIYNNDEIYFICGTDNLNELDTWRKYEYILKNYKLLVIKRNNDNVDNILNKYKNERENIIIADVMSNVLSSTYIRDNIDNNEIKKCLDEKVYEYLKKKLIYRS